MTDKVVDAQAADRARLEEERVALKSSPKQQPISAGTANKTEVAPANNAAPAKRKGK